MESPSQLAVDLGTTHTVAVVGQPGEAPRTLLFDGYSLMDSGVYLDAEGNIVTGLEATRLGANDPVRFEPHPKRRVGEGSIPLGGVEVPVVLLLSAVLSRVAYEARMAGVNPDGALLTCPVGWGRQHREMLTDAARRAGMGEVRLLEEPVAAAVYCTQVEGHHVPFGGSIAVFDFGGGTLDVTVVRREINGWQVASTGGLADLGGVDIDLALLDHLRRHLARRDPETWKRLFRPRTAAELRSRQDFRTEVRGAKEALSRNSAVTVRVPGWDRPLHLTRDELEHVAEPLVARAVEETRRVVEAAGVSSFLLNSLMLVGGSSRMPLVSTRLYARLGTTPSVPEQPELPVAVGALAYHRLSRNEETGDLSQVVAITPESGHVTRAGQAAQSFRVPVAQPKLRHLQRRWLGAVRNAFKTPRD
ncbi:MULTISPECIES: Hsp70 family protein [Catenuloplanes]|uniref:Molecular chaperone DnaK (HSP70) n=1 Tax=Catenuloplanes niger TaxID=587534 RepID=A0AAE3ZVS6_9ACTN|nr:Hsp70 family protein [Catenuloplanes niger]MDR7326716.1 molecular chaperone DnaK (HSP70) [Catenuloplanes niger]